MIFNSFWITLQKSINLWYTKNMLIRENYLQQLINQKDRNIIKVLTGVRRSGKTTIMKQYIEYLLKNKILKSQIIYINMENPEFRNIKTWENLYDFTIEKINENRKNYIFIDEVQMVDKFEKAIDGLFLLSNCDIYLTGSNASLLSSEIATLLTGRQLTIEVLPFSLKEYIQALEIDFRKADKSQIYNDYVTKSSFPYLSGSKITDINDISDYLKSLIDTIVNRDIYRRIDVRNPIMFDNVLSYLLSGIGSEVSINNIVNYITSNSEKVDNKTVSRYIKGLTDAYMLFPVGRFDIRGKELLKTNKKYYAVDPAIRYNILGDWGKDIGHILENVIFLELKRRGYTVNIGKINNLEIDFLAKKADETIYIQVCASALDEKTRERELKPLKAVPDNHKKVLMTFDRIGTGSIEGIQHINAIDWLLDI
jgi:predicted AAA+ superfamily ATPase